MYTIQLRLNSIKTQVKVNCSDENLNHMQSKYVPHHVDNKPKIGHLNNRSLYPKIEEISSIVDKKKLTFFVSVKLGDMSTWRMMRYVFQDIMSSKRRELPACVCVCVCVCVCGGGGGGGGGSYVRKHRGNMGWDTTSDTKYLVSCIYRLPSFCHDRILWKKIVDMFECARITEHPVIFWVILIVITFWMRLYLLIHSAILKLYMAPVNWPTNQHEWMIKPPLWWMSFLRPIQHFIVRVQFLDIHLHVVTIIVFTLIWNLKIPNHQWLITTLWNFVTWKISIWRVSPMN